jgi:predicted Zn-dependent peptidase
MEEVGGDLNAYTSREYTCFVSHALKEHVGLSLDVLSDLVCRPKFSKSDLEKEKQVVLQEIQMSEDMLEDVIFDHYFERVYKGSPLGLPILGTVKSIESQSRASVARFHQRQYRPWNVLVSVAGNINHDEVLDLVQKHLKFKAPSGESQDISKDGGRDTPKTHAFRDVMKRPSEQAHILIGIPAADFRHRLRFESYIVNTLLGGGMTSRLYQTVREDRGLVYSIYSQLVTYTDDGQCLIYAGADPKKAPTVVELVIKELTRLRKNGIKKSDMEMFKTQVRGQILLGADDVENRINSLGINEMVLGTYRSVDDVMKDVEGVTLDGVHEYIETFIDVDRMAILLMGAIPEGPGRAWLKNL